MLVPGSFFGRNETMCSVVIRGFSVVTVVTYGLSVVLYEQACGACAW